MKILILLLSPLYLFAEEPSKATITIEEMQRQLAQKDATIQWLVQMLNLTDQKSTACLEERAADQKIKQLQNQPPVQDKK